MLALAALTFGAIAIRRSRDGGGPPDSGSAGNQGGSDDHSAAGDPGQATQGGSDDGGPGEGRLGPGDRAPDRARIEPGYLTVIFCVRLNTVPPLSSGSPVG